MSKTLLIVAVVWFLITPIVTSVAGWTTALMLILAGFGLLLSSLMWDEVFS